MNGAFDCEVAIIGFGPTGVSAANFLGMRGIKVLALERSPDIYARARAVTINDWTMRCYQSAGLDTELKSVMDVTAALRWITYDRTELNRIEFREGRIGHAPSYSIYQPAMEEKLRAGVEQWPNVSTRFGVEVSRVAQDAAGVTLTLHDGGTVRARYALACDGGSSATREALGIPMLGDTVETRWVVIDARVKRWWPERHILTFWSDKRRPVVDIALSMGNHRWELPLAPEETEADFQTHDQLWSLLATMGVTRDDVEIHQHAFYRHHVRQAERWRDKRIILVGDAAHLMPPWAGQGMQSGVRDTHNLAWKLEAILRHGQPEALLDTYQVERAPDVERYTQISVGLGRLIKQELSEAEMAAMAPSPGEAPPPDPLQAPPSIERGWLTGRGGAVGQFVPQPRVITTSGRISLLDEATGPGFRLFGDEIDPCELLNASQRARWDALGASYFPVRSPLHHSHGPRDLIDIDGTLTAWMREHGARVIAVRPDFFAAASDVDGLDVPGGSGAVETPASSSS